MPRLDKAVRGQRCRLAAVDDCLNDIGRQKGEIDKMGDPALRHAFTVGDRLHGHAGLDLLEPCPAQGNILEKRSVNPRRCVPKHEPGHCQSKPP